jgi:hypothetical protein
MPCVCYICWVFGVRCLDELHSRIIPSATVAFETEQHVWQDFVSWDPTPFD